MSPIHFTLLKNAAGIPDGGKVLANWVDHSRFVNSQSLSMIRDG
jgi:hypothetical protein